MTGYVALLRAVNVGGTGRLTMKALSELCVELGFRNVRTYIQSGNVIFESNLPETAIRKSFEEALMGKLGLKTEVILRTAEELEAVLNENPFPRVEAFKVGVFFQSNPMDDGHFFDNPSGTEEIRMGRREVYIHFPMGMGLSKLRLPTRGGTMRNMNTVSKLADMAGKSQED